MIDRFRVAEPRLFDTRGLFPNIDMLLTAATCCRKAPDLFSRRFCDECLLPWLKRATPRDALPDASFAKANEKDRLSYSPVRRCRSPRSPA